MIELDGSWEEGGGALVRVALALSALTGKDFKVTNIRANRPEPGLKAQHLEAIRALKEICSAETSEIVLGARELYFKPGKIKKGAYDLDIGTAGSISLLSQALLLPCLFAPGKITLKIKGGTCGKWQASVDYLQNLLLPHLRRFVEKIELKVLKRGYYPKGGGEVVIEISPKFKEWYEIKSKVAKINLLQQGQLEQIRGLVNLSQELQEKKVGERIKMAAEDRLRKYGVPVNLRIEYVRSLSVGGEILLWGIFSQDGKVNFDNPISLGCDALVEKGRTSEEIGKSAAEKLEAEIDSRAPVDLHLADQLILFMGLLPESEIIASDITQHVKGNIYVVEKFLPVRFEVEGRRIRVKHL